MRKIKKILVISIMLCLLILSSLFSVKYYKINKIVSIIQENNRQIKNFSYIISYNIPIYYKRDNNIFIQGNNYSFFYYDIDKNLVYTVNNIEKYYIANKIPDGNNIYKLPGYIYLTEDYSIKNKIKLVFDWKVFDYDKNTYEIVTKDKNKIYMNKESGIVTRLVDKDQDVTFEEFKINSVTDEEIEQYSEFLNSYELKTQ